MNLIINHNLDISIEGYHKQFTSLREYTEFAEELEQLVDEIIDLELTEDPKAEKVIDRFVDGDIDLDFAKQELRGELSSYIFPIEEVPTYE